MHKFISACGCNIGRIRSNNEDNFCFNGFVLSAENCGLRDVLFASGTLDKPFCIGVFDGMGGEAFGEEASYIAANVLKEKYTNCIGAPTKVLLDTCNEANEQICAEARKRAVGVIGSTMTALWLEGNEAVLLNLGDSKAFLLRDGSLNQISVEHTDRSRLEALGITMRKPRLTQHLGIDPSEMILEPAIWQESLNSEDYFLLCSDGLTDMVFESKIADILLNQKEPSDCVRQLINTAIEQGGKDNITVIVCRIL